MTKRYKKFKIASNGMKKVLFYILIIITLVGLFNPIHKAQAQLVNPDGTCTIEGKVQPGKWKESNCTASKGSWVGPYVLLAPLPCPAGISDGCVNGKLETYDPRGAKPLGNYLNTMLRIFIAICAVLAMIMIVVGGLEYMTSELISNKESGKNKITGAILGLLLALGSWALLNTINPDLLKSDPDPSNLEDVKVLVNLQDLGGENLSTPFTPINNATLQARGIACDGNGGKVDAVSIGQQFIGKSTYSQTARNTTNASTIFTDCSSFVAQVYNCAGLPSPGGTTAAIFSSGNTRAVSGATYDFNQLNPGDLIGWKQGDNGSGKKVEGNGHVMIYLGGGKVLHSSSTNGGVTISNLSDYQARVTYVKWP